MKLIAPLQSPLIISREAGPGRGSVSPAEPAWNTELLGKGIYLGL